MRLLATAACLVAVTVGVAAQAGVADGGEHRPVAAAVHEGADGESTPWSAAWIAGARARYLGDREARRDALEASLANPSNLYASMRLQSYALPSGGWDALPAWTPIVSPIDDAARDRLRAGEAVLAADAQALWDGAVPTSDAAWIELGRRVFFGYPLRAEPAAAHALRGDDAPAIGIHRDAAGDRPGLVGYLDLDGVPQVGITCALCHASVDDGAVIVGRARRDFDFGAMRLRWHDATHQTVDPRLLSRMASWGPGRADITEDDDQDPVAIPDLWRLRSLRNLTQAATIVHADTDGVADPLALAIRQETQYIHAGDARTRPPRELVWALTMFLYSLEPPASATPIDDAVAERGRALFEARCDRCHGDDDTRSGAPVAAIRVGTDGALAHGRARGTGRYRPAPLVDVRHAAPYLHDGSVQTLAELFDRRRVASREPVLGHAYGFDLSPADRDALVAWLLTL
jgi:hypothetical protein